MTPADRNPVDREDPDFALEPFDDDEEEELDDEFSSDFDPEHIRIHTIDDEGDSDEELDLEAATSALPRHDLTEVLEALAGGDASMRAIYGLSDMAAADVPTFLALWPRVDPDIRLRTVTEAIDLAMDDYRLDLFRFLLAASEDDDPRVRLMVATGLGTVHRTEVAERLLDMVRNDLSDDVRAQTSTSLGPFAILAEFDELPEQLSQKLHDTLFDLAEDEDESWHVRRRAGESVAAFGPNERVGQIIDRMWEEEELGIRPSAIVAMGRGNMRGWIPILHTLLKDEDPELRFEAVRALGEMGDGEALPELSELALHEDDVDIRQEAIMAIGTIGGPTATRILARLADVGRPVDMELIENASAEAALEEEQPDFL